MSPLEVICNTSFPELAYLDWIFGDAVKVTDDKQEALDLSSAPGKRKYSDIALQLLSYVKDEVERASYETKVAKKLGIEVDILREKGDRLNRKLAAKPKKYLKKPKTTIKSDTLTKLENSLLALKVFGGVTKTKIPLAIPEDDARLAELEFVFNQEHSIVQDTDLEREAAELLARYQSESIKQQIQVLTTKLANLDDDDEEYDTILRQIRDLQNQAK